MGRTTPGSVSKARMCISPWQAGQRSGWTSWTGATSRAQRRRDQVRESVEQLEGADTDDGAGVVRGSG